MFYLTTHSTHFILRLYGVRHMVKDHTDSDRGNPIEDNSKGSFYMHHPTDRITHTTAFVTPVVPHRPDSTYHGLWYISRGTLDRIRTSSLGPP